MGYDIFVFGLPIFDWAPEFASAPAGWQNAIGADYRGRAVHVIIDHHCRVRDGSMVQCQECGADYSRYSDFCPRCMGRGLAYALISVMCYLMIVATTGYGFVIGTLVNGQRGGISGALAGFELGCFISYKLIMKTTYMIERQRKRRGRKTLVSIPPRV